MLNEKSGTIAEMPHLKVQRAHLGPRAGASGVRKFGARIGTECLQELSPKDASALYVRVGFHLTKSYSDVFEKKV